MSLPCQSGSLAAYLVSGNRLPKLPFDSAAPAANKSKSLSHMEGGAGVHLPPSRATSLEHSPVPSHGLCIGDSHSLYGYTRTGMTQDAGLTQTGPVGLKGNIHPGLVPFPQAPYTTCTGEANDVPSHGKASNMAWQNRVAEGVAPWLARPSFGQGSLSSAWIARAGNPEPLFTSAKQYIHKGHHRLLFVGDSVANASSGDARDGEGSGKTPAATPEISPCRSVPVSVPPVPPANGRADRNHASGLLCMIRIPQLPLRGGIQPCYIEPRAARFGMLSTWAHV
ncbi:hypothetical protein M747DRAFT_245702 [Aspergillus niger ATCC 13496]|uniref:Uncharacterized protein n=3 Tax=Aspergillus niger TaxID=5061 RepID=A2QSK2_ASPNC|nr:hypothetical protein An08g11020 [Aspergillus niger]RDH16240.1 hypothetical protein M747DRAFT_245702 [Aspergillus niger ATCC 13496]CAK45774.1 hypothetical protein An08g11020 [Aspergillus niger]